METRQYTVYKFEELSEEVKVKAIEKWYENEDYPFLEEELRQQIEYSDKIKIFSDIKPSYSLSCCQGDGLSFSAEIDLGAWLKAKYPKLTTKTIEKTLAAVYKFQSKGNTGRYCYASNSDIEWEDQGKELPDQLRKNIDRFRDEIAEYYLNICKDAEDTGYDILDYRMDNKEFSELCESNGYMFKENGQLD